MRYCIMLPVADRGNGCYRISWITWTCHDTAEEAIQDISVSAFWTNHEQRQLLGGRTPKVRPFDERRWDGLSEQQGACW